jgi:hypothetical protein
MLSKTLIDFSSSKSAAAAMIISKGASFYGGNDVYPNHQFANFNCCKEVEDEGEDQDSR